MHLVEHHVITRADRRFTAIDCAAFASKNLYNKALYGTRQAYWQDGSLPTYPSLYHQIKGEPEYHALPRKVAQWVLKQVCLAWDGYCAASAAYAATPSAFPGRPRLPRYATRISNRDAIRWSTPFRHAGLRLPATLTPIPHLPILLSCGGATGLRSEKRTDGCAQQIVQ
ncbi:MAG TPA: hypothetical protein VGP82_18470 [Ktedonobacterales bacterium]|nr:hypothetical protein [Ktedonobacterales bacterium]